MFQLTANVTERPVVPMINDGFDSLWNLPSKLAEEKGDHCCWWIFSSISLTERTHIAIYTVDTTWRKQLVVAKKITIWVKYTYNSDSTILKLTLFFWLCWKLNSVRLRYSHVFLNWISALLLLALMLYYCYRHQNDF